MATPTGCVSRLQLILDTVIPIAAAVDVPVAADRSLDVVKERRF